MNRVRTHRSLLHMVAIFMMMLSGCVLTMAQANADQLRVDTNLVLVNVLATDKSGNSIAGLTRDRFQLLDDGKLREIEEFSAGSMNVSLGIVYDMHPSTAEGTKEVLASLTRLNRELSAGDELFFLAFDSHGLQPFDFIPNFDQLQRHMAAPDRRQTRSLYDALFTASEKMQKARNRKRVLIVISDTDDHNSQHSFSEVQRRLTASQAEVYAVTVDDRKNFTYADLTHERGFRHGSHDKALETAAMRELTSKSGGATYVDSPKGVEQLSSIYRQIISEMRSHYTLGFYIDKPDANQHKLRIKLVGQDQKGVSLKYPSTYPRDIK